MADKKRDTQEFFEQSNFEQFTPTREHAVWIKRTFIFFVIVEKIID